MRHLSGNGIMAAMGTLRTTVGIQHLSQTGAVHELPETMVDTGSEHTWVPRKVLESLDIAVQRRQQFIVADGRHIERDIGYAIVHAAGCATADDVVFAEAEDLVLLGVRSIAGLNLRVDVVGKKLVDAGPIIVGGRVAAQRRLIYERATTRPPRFLKRS